MNVHFCSEQIKIKNIKSTKLHLEIILRQSVSIVKYPNHQFSSIKISLTLT